MERKCKNCGHKMGEDPCMCLDCDPETLNQFTMSREAMIEVIRQKLSRADLWGQLAEEAAELAQAALKMQRYLNGTNPPRKSYEECKVDVVEEHADVALCFEILDWHDKYKREEVQEEKLPRWIGVIEKGENNG